MEKKESGKGLYYIMRVLHRDVGFLTLGLTLVYVLSGVLLIYRNTDFLKKEQTSAFHLKQNLPEEDLAKQLAVRNLRVEKKEGDVIYFKEGCYNVTTGEAKISRKDYPPLIKKFVNLHKVTGDNRLSLFNTIYGTLLLFLAVSSLFMFKLGTGKSKRGLALTGLGIMLTILFLFLI
ncbi:MAG: hypothetical protein A2W86_13220 [Bacteroidetes bacterium GWD2_45_23]|nr:MAG: hypothetical protein A2W87_06480 [Bacteroidetes bacterium GWC2_46_850]OFX72944.1 MAG: hypothetical protein A2071_06970 [Bacteroidetes bacterium GWC1_47_7]OFX84594.1 MAG: hypothetical protein A2W86_13220 [Bacteroidetes bacterium GWD2_45_23]HAR38708.1 hypothetical protein [Porphyromonadaceae bacterium]HBB00178.1 hypothetical protein [Porphyromonadaceae bacterium]